MGRRLRQQVEGSLPWDPVLALEAMEELFPKVEFLSYEEAREFVGQFKFENVRDWREYRKSYKKTIINIPSHPETIYKNEGWISWGDFLGTENVFKKDFLSFKKARQFVRKLGIKSYREWENYCKTGKKPCNIPYSPNTTYKDKGWISLGDFLGTGYIAHQNRVYLSFKKAREFVKKLNIEGTKEWFEYCRSGKKPHNIPSHPDRVYEDKGWVGMGEWLGNGHISYQNRIYLSLKEARGFIKKLKLKSKTEWLEYSKYKKRPSNIPSNPDKFYKDIGWVSFGDFLGTGYICNKDRAYLSFKEARKFVKKLKLKDTKEWNDYCKSSKRPHNISAKPERIYKDKGWISLGDFLGTGYVACVNRTFLSFKDARKIVRKLDFKSSTEWIEYCKSENRLNNIPSNPNKNYKNEWISWPDFLGNISKKTEKQHIKFMKKNNIINSNQWVDYRKDDNFQGQGYLTNPWRAFGKTAKQFFVEIRNC